MDGERRGDGQAELEVVVVSDTLRGLIMGGVSIILGLIAAELVLYRIESLDDSLLRPFISFGLQWLFGGTIFAIWCFFLSLG